MRALVLWDVDLTLVDLRRMGGAWYRRAVTEVTGREPVAIPSFGGRTDRWITMELLTGVGCVPSEELISRVQAAATAIAAEQRPDIARKGVLLPGVVDALRAIAALPDVEQSPVTGNLRPIAGYKVAAFGLDPYLDLEIGGYGSVSEHRAELVADAVARATAKHGRSTDTVVVVGDTPHDVHAALDHGARAVGVATGRHTEGDLLAAGAHAVLPDLRDTGTVLETLMP